MKTASNSRVLQAIPLLITICLLSLPAYAQYSGGTGEPNEPYQIATAEDLIALGETPDDYDKHFILTKNIDLSAFSFDRAVIAPDVNDDEVWFQGTDFTGFFDGNDHKISHLTIKGVDYLGLFGMASAKAEISNLELEAVNVNGTGRFVGGLAGRNDGSITSCYSTGAVIGDFGVGGLVGIVGFWSHGSITASHSSGTVSGDSCVGGLVGANGAPFFGGSGRITTSYSTGTVSGNDSVGGLVGSNLKGSITNSYSTGTVSGSDLVGGLAGTSGGWGGSITASYSTGSVSGGSSVGGLVGDNTLPFVSITMSLWDMEASGRATSAGGVGLTTAEMMDPYMLGLNGFANDPNWVLDVGRDYPRLAWEGTPGQFIPEPVIDWLDGQGTEQEPYRIDTADQLILLSRASILWDRHFILCADIDLDPNLQGRRVFSQAVIQDFSGVFDGNGHTISHLTIVGDSHLGLFGGLGPGALVSNLALEEVNVNGTGRYVGGLVGANDGSITTSCITGTVNGSNFVGSLVGSNNYYGSITTSYSTGSVRGDDYVGGLVGTSYGSITTSYSTGTVSGNSFVGGLVGSGDPTLVCNSVWDMETSGLAVSDGGVGLATAEMMDPYMLGLNGFANDPNWVLDAGRDYPRLAWEGTAGEIIPEPVIDWLDGQGTEQEPYRIETADQLILLRGASGLWDKHFILCADIDLDPNLPGREVFSQAVIQVFSGVFDGNGHIVSHLTIVGDSYLGLFGKLGSGAFISNLALEAVNVNGTGGNVGGLVGENRGFIDMSSSTGSVSGGYRVGGLVGINDGSITRSHSSGTVTGNEDGGDVGGLVGRSSGSIAASYSTGSVSGNDSVGGLVGSSSGSIAASYSTGTVTGDYHVGGLVGSSSGSITSSYNTGSVNGDRNVGGLVGGSSGSITTSYSSGTVTGNEDGGDVGGLVGRSSGSITASYSTASVIGDRSVGGLVGENGGSITNSYSTGTVSGDSRVGGLVGVGGDGVTSSFWDIETSGQATSDGGIGATTAEMHSVNTYLNAGWDFVDEIVNGIWDFWQISPGDYPRLRYCASNGPAMPEGSGTVEQPYLIRDVADLASVWLKPLAHYRLEASLDLSGIMWSMAVVPWFGGTFDGNGHVISNLHIQGVGSLGLFGHTGSGAMISNLALEAVDVNGAGDAIGGLVGRNSGSITTSYSTGIVSGNDSVGGLVGSNEGSITTSYSTDTVNGDEDVGGLVGSNEGSITTSYSTGTVSGGEDPGGLVGQNEGSITSSYSSGEVNGGGEVGGLVGDNYGSITASYSTGSVHGNEAVGGLVGSNNGTITSSFWDIETSGQATSEGGTGATTAKMHSLSTYLDAGWDFIDEIENGTGDIWWILEGQGYPHLWWELPADDLATPVDSR